MSAMTTQGVLRLGTRGSALALAQSGQVADAIAAPVELVTVSTTGDRDRRRPVEQLGGTGVFVSALRDALLEGHIDLAVHSYKDLPTAAAPGLTIAAVPARVDARDALVARDGLTLDQLPAGAKVGTGAVRRAAQLRAYRPDLQLVPIRGNVDTRLGKVADGSLDAVVVAYAGLLRLGRADAATEVIDSSIVLPAPAQGALAVECRSGHDNNGADLGVPPTTDHGGDEALRATLAALNDPASRATVTAERALLATLEAGCTAPVGAHAQADTTTVVLDGAVAAVDGSAVIRRQATGPVSDAGAVGQRLAADLLAAGASDLLGSSR
jgi:hydroxymethylbilane synthase